MENDSGFHTRDVITSEVTLIASSTVIVPHFFFVTLSAINKILFVMLLHIFCV
jgi:hypothetical protein